MQCRRSLRASPRRVRTLGGQFRKLPELTVHRPSLRLRGDTLWLTIEHDGNTNFAKSLGSGLTLGLTLLTSIPFGHQEGNRSIQRSPGRLGSACGKWAARYREMPSTAGDRSLKLSVKVTAQRSRHLDKGCGTRYRSRSEPISAAGMTRKEAAVKPTSARPGRIDCWHCLRA